MDATTFLKNIQETMPKPSQKKLLTSMLTSIIGKPCRIQLLNNSILQGSLKSLSNNITIEHQNSILSIPTKKFLSMTIRFQIRKLKTDSEISSKPKSTRNLQQWVTEGPEIVLEDSDRYWDQFEVNKSKYGVTSTYNEELYTTKKVDLSELSKEQVKRALKIEKEILKKVNEDEAEDDEEKMFGAVIGTGRYAKNIEMPEDRNAKIATRDRAISVGSCSELSKDNYKKTRELLLHPKNKPNKAKKLKKLEALDLNITPNFNEDVMKMFSEFKKEKEPSKEVLVKNFQDFSLSLKRDKLEVISEENPVVRINNVSELMFETWRKAVREVGPLEW